MKKLVYIIILIVMLMCLTGCGLHSDEDNPTLDINENAAFDGNLDNTDKSLNDEDSFIFTWIT